MRVYAVVDDVLSPDFALGVALGVFVRRGSPKFERAARRWLIRYLSEGTPSLSDVAKVTASLATREP